MFNWVYERHRLLKCSFHSKPGKGDYSINMCMNVRVCCDAYACSVWHCEHVRCSCSWNYYCLLLLLLLFLLRSCCCCCFEFQRIFFFISSMQPRCFNCFLLELFMYCKMRIWNVDSTQRDAQIYKRHICKDGHYTVHVRAFSVRLICLHFITKTHKKWFFCPPPVSKRRKERNILMCLWQLEARLATVVVATNVIYSVSLWFCTFAGYHRIRYFARECVCMYVLLLICVCTVCTLTHTITHTCEWMPSHRLDQIEYKHLSLCCFFIVIRR